MEGIFRQRNFSPYWGFVHRVDYVKVSLGFDLLEARSQIENVELGRFELSVRCEDRY